jgi:hypothetical protein
MHFGFCPHIDAACRLIEDQKTWAGIQPFAQHDFLLIAAG